MFDYYVCSFTAGEKQNLKSTNEPQEALNFLAGNHKVAVAVSFEGKEYRKPPMLNASVGEFLQDANSPALSCLVNGYKIVWNNFHGHFTLSHDEIDVIDHHSDFDYIYTQAANG